jgi:K+-transporting ATPase A subunit
VCRQAGWWRAIPQVPSKLELISAYAICLSGLTTDTPLFAGLVIATILVVGALSYLPVLALGPLVEHLALR